jgi:hypothetical protein
MQINLDRLGKWAVENEMKINPGKSKAVSFTRARVKGSPNHFFLGGGGDTPKNSESEQLQICRNNHTQ